MKEIHTPRRVVTIHASSAHPGHVAVGIDQLDGQQFGTTADLTIDETYQLIDALLDTVRATHTAA